MSSDYPVHDQYPGKIVIVDVEELGPRPAIIVTVNNKVDGSRVFCQLVVFTERGTEFRNAQEEANGHFTEIVTAQTPQKTLFTSSSSSSAKFFEPQ